MLPSTTLFMGDYCLWSNTIVKFSLIIEGATGKVLQFIMHLKLINNKNILLIEQKCIFEPQKGQNKKKIIKITLFLSQNIFAVYLFRVAPYILIFVLHKGALFH